jgi:outer membrane protein assembly factor BamA
VLAVCFAGEVRRPYDNSVIPFYYLSELGTAESIRGFARGRFRDRDMLLGSLEYRYPVWRNWNERGMDLILFADTGQVANNIFEEAEMKNFKTGVGFGYRLWNLKGLVSTLYMAHSEDGWRIYFELN